MVPFTPSELSWITLIWAEAGSSFMSSLKSSVKSRCLWLFVVCATGFPRACGRLGRVSICRRCTPGMNGIFYCYYLASCDFVWIGEVLWRGLHLAGYCWAGYSYEKRGWLKRLIGKPEPGEGLACWNGLTSPETGKLPGWAYEGPLLSNLLSSCGCICPLLVLLGITWASLSYVLIKAL